MGKCRRPPSYKQELESDDGLKMEWGAAISWELRDRCGCYGVYVPLFLSFFFLLFTALCVSKNTGSEFDPERVHWGQTQFRVNDDPEISQLDAGYDPELGQSDPITCQVCRKLTNFRVIFDPEWSLAPMDPFPGHADPGVFRVYRLASTIERGQD